MAKHVLNLNVRNNKSLLKMVNVCHVVSMKYKTRRITLNALQRFVEEEKKWWVMVHANYVSLTLSLLIMGGLVFRPSALKLLEIGFLKMELVWNAHLIKCF